MIGKDKYDYNVKTIDNMTRIKHDVKMVARSSEI